MEKLRSLSYATLICILTSACGGGPSGPDPGIDEVPTVLQRGTITYIIDGANAGDGTDVHVGISRASDERGIAEYRVVLIPAAEAATYGAEQALLAPAGSYRSVPTGAGATDFVFGADATDTAGNPVQDGGSYVVRLLSVPAGEGFTASISPASQAITLAETLLVETLVPEIIGGSGGMDVDAEGNIYFADFGNSLGAGPPGTTVFKITPEGQVSVFASGLQGASGNHFDSHGNLFQSSIAGSYVSKITPDGEVSTFVSEGINNPVGIAIDGDDNLYVANCGNNTIRFVTADGVSTPFASSTLLNCPNGITLADDGNLYVANFGNGNVLRVSPEGDVSVHATLPGGNNGHLLFGNGVLYVVARSAHQLYEVTLDGEISLLAGSGVRGQLDGSALDARLSLTNDVALSPDGSILYFNDVTTFVGTQIISPVSIRKIVLR